MRININYDTNGEIVDLPNNEYIKLLLRLKNIRQWQLANLMGVSEATIGRILRSKLQPTMFLKMRLALNDDIDMSWVAPGARVKHARIGEGIIETVDKDSDDVVVDFSGDRRHFNLSYVVGSNLLYKA